MEGQKYLRHILRSVARKKTSVVLFLLCVVPIIIFLWLFWPWQKIDLKSLETDKVVYISDIEIIKPSFRSMAADVMQVPLGLRWYDICLINRAYLEEPRDCIEIKQPVLRVYFEQGDPDKYSNTSLKKAFDGLTTGKIYDIPFKGKRCFSYSGQEGFLINVASVWEGRCASTRDLGSSIRFDYEFYAKPKLYALFIKFFLILIFWIVLLASLLTIFSFCKGQKFTNNKDKSTNSKKK